MNIPNLNKKTILKTSAEQSVLTALNCRVTVFRDSSDSCVLQAAGLLPWRRGGQGWVVKGYSVSSE